MSRITEKPLLYNARFRVYWTGLSAPTVYAQQLDVGSLKGCEWQHMLHGGESFWYRRHKHGLIQMLRELRKKSGGVMYTIQGDPVYATMATSGEWNAMFPDVPVIAVDVSGIKYLIEVLQLNPYMGDWKVVKSWIEGQPRTNEYAVPRVVKHPITPEFNTWAHYIQHWVWEDYNGVENVAGSDLSGSAGIVHTDPATRPVGATADAGAAAKAE